MKASGRGRSLSRLVRAGLAFLVLPAELPMAKETANRLIHEKSPYLLQHADNPVDWYPWGEEAFEKARKEDKPILLSIGYSTCHWCHVMERESFVDPAVAAIMNRHFVCIKMDREEHPHIDKIYMTAVQAMTGQGGWPLNVFLTPDLKPFFGGTYFPPDARWGRPGWPQLLERIGGLWKTDRSALLEDSRRLASFLEESARLKAGQAPLDEAWLKGAFQALRQSFDQEHGGFAEAPKFPMPANINFLLRYHSRTGEARALEMAVKTLQGMARGGIHDHIGGGFARYSTDERWHIPHFEKMLYDNSQIAVNYLEAYQLTRDENLARTARSALDYILRDMAHPEGGFYSAEDADSLPPERVGEKGAEKSEGAFYLWSQEELLKLLGPETGKAFCLRYGVEPGGNARSDPQGEFRGRNILYEARPLKEVARLSGLQEEDLRARLDSAREKLLKVRSGRPRPHRDDKHLTSWNGLMISALARAGRILENPKYLQAAEKAARFLRGHLLDTKGRLYHRWREGERKVPGLADDYAFLAQGLLDLYESSLDVQWLAWALELSEEQQRLFYDGEGGGYYLSAASEGKHLLVRLKDDSDNVEPAASSVAALNLLRLAQFTGREDLRRTAEKTLGAFGERMRERPLSLSQMLVALDFALSKPLQVVVAGKRGAQDTSALLREVHSRFLPHRILYLAEGKAGGSTQLDFKSPFPRSMAPIQGKAAAYVCENYACKLPTTDPKELGGLLDEARAAAKP